MKKNVVGIVNNSKTMPEIIPLTKSVYQLRKKAYQNTFKVVFNSLLKM